MTTIGTPKKLTEARFPSANQLPTTWHSPRQDRAGRSETASTSSKYLGLHLTIGYLLLLAVTEALTSLIPVTRWLRLIPYGIVAALLILHTMLCRDRPIRYLPLTLVCGPIARLALLLQQPSRIPMFLPLLSVGLPVVAGIAISLYLLLSESFAPLWPLFEWRLKPLLLRRNVIGLILVSVAMILLALLAGILVAWSSHRAPPHLSEDSAWIGKVIADGDDEISPEVEGIVHEEENSFAQMTVTRVTALLARIPLENHKGPPFPESMGPAVGMGRRIVIESAPSSNLGSTARPRAKRPVGSLASPPALSDLPLVLDDIAEIRANVVAADRPDYQRKDTPPSNSPMETLLTAYPDCPTTGFHNPFPRGLCTWYVKEKRKDIPAFSWDSGLAANWADSAERCGFPVNERPAAGAVIVFPPGANGSDSGHVAYVEKVDHDYVLISECNVTHNDLWTVDPRWWEAGYACAHRRIFFDRLDPGILYIHRRPEESGRGIRGLQEES